MTIIARIFFAIFVISSCSNYCSRPAVQSGEDSDSEPEVVVWHLDDEDDDFGVPEVSLRQANKELKQCEDALQQQLAQDPNQHLVKNFHGEYLTHTKQQTLFYKTAQQHKQQIAQQEGINLQSQLETAYKQYQKSSKKYLTILTAESVQKDPFQLWSAFCLAERQRNVRTWQAAKIAAEKRKSERILQAQIQSQDNQIQSQARQIQSLQRQLQQARTPEPQAEGVPNPMPQAPGGPSSSERKEPEQQSIQDLIQSQARQIQAMHQEIQKSLARWPQDNRPRSPSK